MARLAAFGVVLLMTMKTCYANNSSLANWMSQLNEPLRSCSLTQLAIPGSHDSGSYSMKARNAIMYGIEPKFSKLFEANANDSDAIRFLSTLMHRWGKTQSLNISEQLMRGVRYLDIRLALGRDRKMRIAHGLLGITLRELLQQVRDFYLKHPLEVILLDMNHILGATAETHRSILNETLEILHSRICPAGLVPTVSLRQLWKGRYNVILFYESYPDKTDPLYQHFACDGSVIESPYQDKIFEQRKTWMKFLSEQYNKRRQTGVFHVTQGIMTPHWLHIIAAAATSNRGTLQRWISDDATLAIVNWLKGKRAGVNGINIVIADFVENHNFVESVLALNNVGSDLPHSALLIVLMVFLSIVLFV